MVHLTNLPDKEKFLAVWTCCCELFLLGRELGVLYGCGDGLLTAATVAVTGAVVPVPFLVTRVTEAAAGDPCASGSLFWLRPEDPHKGSLKQTAIKDKFTKTTGGLIWF
jgi:hypothetical protein